jgi:hypothetical protein
MSNLGTLLTLFTPLKNEHDEHSEQGTKVHKISSSIDITITPVTG